MKSMIMAAIENGNLSVARQLRRKGGEAWLEKANEEELAHFCRRCNIRLLTAEQKEWNTIVSAWQKASDTLAAWQKAVAEAGEAASFADVDGIADSFGKVGDIPNAVIDAERTAADAVRAHKYYESNGAQTADKCLIY